MKHTAPISSVATWGSYVATGGYDNRVILWNATTRKALAQGWHDHLVNHCAFSSNGGSALVASTFECSFQKCLINPLQPAAPQ